MGKNKKVGKTFLGYKTGQEGNYRSGQVFRDCKSGQDGLQMGAAFGKESGQKDYKSGRGFQIGVKRFQTGADVTNRCKTNVSVKIKIKYLQIPM